MVFLQLPAIWDKVPKRVEVMAKRELDLEKHEHRLERFLGRLLGQVAGLPRRRVRACAEGKILLCVEEPAPDLPWALSFAHRAPCPHEGRGAAPSRPDPLAERSHRVW